MSHYFTNENLESNLKKMQVCISLKNFNLYTDNGVFSKKGLDFGSRTLIDALLKENIFGDVLDLGCGYGSIGIILSSFFNINLDMVDVNLRAMHLARRNAKENDCSNINIFESNCYQNITSKYNTIITNPPIRAGKKIVYEILMSAKKYLEQDGNLFLVIRKEQGAKSIISDLEKEYNVEILEKKKGFFVLKCTI